MSHHFLPVIVRDPRFRAGRTAVQRGEAEQAIAVFATLLEEARRTFAEHKNDCLVETSPAYYEYGNALFRSWQQQQQQQEEEETTTPAASSREAAAAAAERRAVTNKKPAAAVQSETAAEKKNEEQQSAKDNMMEPKNDAKPPPVPSLMKLLSPRRMPKTMTIMMRVTTTCNWPWSTWKLRGLFLTNTAKILHHTTTATRTTRLGPRSRPHVF